MTHKVNKKDKLTGDRIIINGSSIAAIDCRSSNNTLNNQILNSSSRNWCKGMVYEVQIVFLLSTTGSNARFLDGDGFCCGQKTDGDTEKLGELHFEVLIVLIGLEDCKLKNFDLNIEFVYLGIGKTKAF